MTENSRLLTRRTAMKRMLALFGGTLTAAQLGLVSRAAAAMTEDAAPLFFDDAQFSMLTRIADLIVPQTETPGALAAGVPRFIDMMFAEWASAERQASWTDGLAEIDARARDSGMASFNAGSAEQQTALLRTLDREFFEGDSRPTFFSGLKQMVLFAYYNSEIGATVELRYQPVPGDYRSCVPVDEIGRGWFWNGYSYGL